MGRTRLLLGCLASALLLLALVGCGAAEAPTATPAPTPTPIVAQPKYGGVMNVAQRGDPASWDPMAINIFTAVGLSHPLYGEGNLVKNCRDNIYQVCPSLAERWEANADFTQWTFKIRDNAYWHDGKPFTAEDAKFWVDLSVNGAPPDRKPAYFKANFDPLVKTEALDGNRFRVTLAKPRPGYLEALIEIGNQIAHPKHLVEPELQKGNKTVGPQEINWVATGPFKMLKYDKGAVVQYRKFDKYWEKDERGRQLPFLDGIDFPIIKEPSAMVAAFRTGRIDTTAKGSGFHLTPEAKDQIAKDLGDKVYFVNIPYLAESITPNSLRTPWNDVRLRKALSLYMDRQAGIQSIYGGFAELSTFWAPNSPWVNPDFRTWPGYNPATKEKDRAEAKRLLTEAGYPNGFKTTLMCRDLWVKWCEFLEGQLTGLLGQGNVTIDVVDTAKRGARIATGDFDIHPDSYFSLFPTEGVSDFLTTNPNADVKHNDKKVDEYFDRLLTVTSFEEKVKLSREIERYILQQQYLTTYTWYQWAVLAFRSYVKGVAFPAQNSALLTDFVTTWMDK
ncbi:MAG: ABC transporter substrate-binding protein [Chloroflexi bacterium]|nr:ABC transporter substrate-binding protein [Chloroflexota bacterium]